MVFKGWTVETFMFALEFHRRVLICQTRIINQSSVIPSLKGCYPTMPLFLHVSENVIMVILRRNKNCTSFIRTDKTMSTCRISWNSLPPPKKKKKKVFFHFSIVYIVYTSTHALNCLHFRNEIRTRDLRKHVVKKKKALKSSVQRREKP